MIEDILAKAGSGALLERQDALRLLEVATGSAEYYAPVSYTHLDVYKRQPFFCASAFFMMMVFILRWGTSGERKRHANGGIKRRKKNG